MQAFHVLPGTHSLLDREGAHVGKVSCPRSQYHSAKLVTSQSRAPRATTAQRDPTKTTRLRRLILVFSPNKYEEIFNNFLYTYK